MGSAYPTTTSSSRPAPRTATSVKTTGTLCARPQARGRRNFCPPSDVGGLRTCRGGRERGGAAATAHLRHCRRRPTGVELAGAIAELARVGMEKDFRNFDPATAEIILLQSGPRLLPAFPQALSEVARRSLADAGVKVLVNSEVRLIDADGVMVNDRRIYSRTVLWAAGVA